MSPEAQRIAIAEACGWFFGQTGCRAPDGRIISSYPIHNQIAHAPDYLGDLNAMHEAEKTLLNEQFDRYRADLWNVVGNKDYAFESCAPLPAIRFFVAATAAQRAKALLLTLGKWEDGK